MIGNFATKDFISNLVPISRFNKGEAGKVFNELKKSGIKIVLKNNTPAGILLSPEVYEEIKEALEDYRLFIEADNRMKKSCEDDYISSEEAMKVLGITAEDLSIVDVDSE